MSIPISKHLMTKIHEDDLMRVTSNVIHNEVCEFGSQLLEPKVRIVLIQICSHKSDRLRIIKNTRFMD